ncbi:hypothetical protein PCANC_18852 [Puccinia coronata f. sp. avenae]|uniref:Uncharacterized protein n=1 Tax=Puccinia coronata f. sp. avenae TaxID=200324 RepID=A0A2N5U8E3_9BASI|nr:hypothetical protein PCANC_18852 [Puccinia coronata f. sp. avenae]
MVGQPPGHHSWDSGPTVSLGPTSEDSGGNAWSSRRWLTVRVVRRTDGKPPPSLEPQHLLTISKRKAQSMVRVLSNAESGLYRRLFRLSAV